MKTLSCLLMTLLIIGTAQGQTITRIGAGTSLHIASGSSINFDGLTLTPSAPFTLTGLLDIARSGSATPAPPAAYVQRVYTFSGSVIAYSGALQINYLDAELAGANENTVRLTLYNGSTWVGYTSTARSASSNFVTTSGLSNVSFSAATLAEPFTPLPVTLSRFWADKQPCGAVFRWTTSFEQNSSHFEIERSPDGLQFEKIGVVAAAGSSTSARQYNYNWTGPAGTWYFRLRSVDLDGSAKYAPVLTLQISCGSAGITIYPNPARNQVFLSGLSAGAMVTLSDAKGRKLRLLRAMHREEVLQLSGLASGVYFITIQSPAGTVQSWQIIKE